VKAHPEALTAEQQAVLAASHEVAGRWGAYLAGGTALTLHLGHRRSVDLDWFTKNTVKPGDLMNDLNSLGFPVSVRQNDEGTFLGHVGEVQYSVFRYRYELVARPSSYQRCSLAALEDIAAMKMSAIVQRATKRDYVDLHAMLVGAKLPMREVVATMRRKYPGVDPSMSLRALGYFKDVEKQAMPDMLAKTTWEEVKKGLSRVCQWELGGPDR
jgi:hypothetical protein